MVVESIMELRFERADRRISSSMRGVGDLLYFLSRAEVFASTRGFSVLLGSLEFEGLLGFLLED